MEPETIEEMIAAMEKRGWRMTTLSCIGRTGYSCILERKRKAEDGYPIFVFSNKELTETPREAVAQAWKNAQTPLDNPRVAKRVGHSDVELLPLSKWLNDNIGYRVRLEYALTDLLKSHGVEVEEDDEAF